VKESANYVVLQINGKTDDLVADTAARADRDGCAGRARGAAHRRDMGGAAGVCGPFEELVIKQERGG
jgi:hypothetical protein